jgi:transcriptional regulator with XRE-family HTH domain
MSPTNGDLGQAIRRLRRARKLTIETLAFAAKMHPTYLSGIERGVRNPTWTKLCGLTEALGVTVSQLTREAEDECEVAHATREARARLKSSVHSRPNR